MLSSAGSCLFLMWVSRSYFEVTLEGYVQNTKKMLKFGVQIFSVNAIEV